MNTANQKPEAVDEHFLTAIGELAPRPTTSKAAEELWKLFDAQAGSRHVDLLARQLGSRGLGYYSIGSAGHESNAAVAAALRPDDPALLHYRSGGFYTRRAHQLVDQQPLRDMVLGIVASTDEPIASGRHKVFGHPDFGIIPQTSTIASHLPRAVGLAFALDRANRLDVEHRWSADSVVVCSFGDASANHSTATGAINAALHCAYQRIAMPLLLVCEDNGIGISVRTPGGWIESAYQRAGLRYFSVDGDDPTRCLEVSRQASDWVRRHRSPAFLHLRTVRLMGHAGSDVESSYRAGSEIRADYDRDPLLATAKELVERGASTPDEVVRRYEELRRDVAQIADEALSRPTLTNAVAVMSAIATDRPAEVARSATTPPDEQRRRSAFGAQLPESEGPITLAQAVNRCLADELARDDGVLVFGEDVSRKGGVYGVTRGLRKKFGGNRVFDTLLDEQSILGTALGAGLAGMLPVPEIQYLAYLHNAADQLRGEAATLSFFSSGSYRNPMVVRVAGYGYQKGFGGHFHNDNSVAALRDIPGVVVASPACPDDAAAMLRTCLAAARADGRVCVFLEPIALYHTKDLHESGDGGWAARYPEHGTDHVPIGRGRVHGDGSDLTLVTHGNGLFMSLRVARRLHQRGIGVRVLDLRWLAPLPTDDLLAAARDTGKVLVVDETRRSGGVSESVVTALIDGGFDGSIARVTSEDSFIPLGKAAYHVLLDESTIERSALDLAAGTSRQ